MNAFSRTQEVMSRYFKQWAFTVSLDGDSVQIHTQGNVAFARQKLAEHGLGQVRVSYCV